MPTKKSHAGLGVQCALLIILAFGSAIASQIKEQVKVLFHLEDAKAYPIPGGECHLYPDAPTGRLSCALVKQKGRYPEKGMKVNERCTEAIYVIEGAFKITLNDDQYDLKKDDVIYIVPGTKYSIDGNGKVFVFIEPKWDSKQNTSVD